MRQLRSWLRRSHFRPQHERQRPVFEQDEASLIAKFPTNEHGLSVVDNPSYQTEAQATLAIEVEAFE